MPATADPDPPLPFDPQLDMGRAPALGGLAWSLAHGLDPASLRDITVERLDAEGGIRRDEGVEQAWQHALRHADRLASDVCFSHPGPRQPQPAARLAACPAALRPAASRASGALSEVERHLNDHAVLLTERFMRNLDMQPPPGEAPDEQAMDRFLAQGAGVSYITGQPLGRHYWRHPGDTLSAEEAAECLPERLFHRTLDELEFLLLLSIGETVRALGLMDAEDEGEDLPPMARAALDQFEIHVAGCIDRLCTMGRIELPHDDTPTPPG